jgi:transposase
MKKYLVQLSQEQRQSFQQIVTSGVASARKIMHAQILLKADSSEAGPAWSDEQIQQTFGVGLSTVERVRKRFVEKGFDDALNRRPQPERPEKRKIAGMQEAQLLALACGPVPSGYQGWSVRLLADRFVVMETGEKVGRETIRRTLKKMHSSPG